MCTLLIKNGKVVDGSGNYGYEADICISEGRIVDIKPDICEKSEKVIDADGLVVAPGFIDIHSHSDASIFDNPLSDSKLLQGVTSEVTGNCGIGLFPVNTALRNELSEYLSSHSYNLDPTEITWTDLKGYAKVLDDLDLGVNILPLVPHGILRSVVMGFEDKKASLLELKKMEGLLETALEQGAWGMSAGLIYPPGSFADTEELVALSKVLAKFDAIFNMHIRGESEKLLDAIKEAIYVCRESSAKIQISHLKAMGKDQWGLGKKLIDILSKARKEGLNIGADQYPYAASSTALTAIVPRWAHSGGIGKLLERFADPDQMLQIKKEIKKEIENRGGADCILIASTASERNSICNGKTVETLSKKWGIPPVDVVVKLLIEERCAVSAVYFSMSEEDVKTIIANETVSVGSDGWGLCAETNKDKSVHPRSYGTFPRVLGKYVRKEKLLPLETAVYKMTHLTAKRLGLEDRGLLRKGFVADITIFDPDTIIDRSEYTNPHKHPDGIEYVIVNGQIAVENGKLTGKAAGKVLLKR